MTRFLWTCFDPLISCFRDFVTNFLLCQEGLQSPGQDLILRLTQTSVLPFYLLVLTVCLLSSLQGVCRRLR